MTIYYFGYNKFNGSTFPVKWVEEDGKAVGGRPVQIMQKHEITFDDYRNTNLFILSEKYPLKVIVEETTPPG